MPAKLEVVRGGVRLVREQSGNMMIYCRGDGAAECQSADIPDLLAAIADVLRHDLDGHASLRSETTTPPEQVSTRAVDK